MNTEYNVKPQSLITTAHKEGILDKNGATKNDLETMMDEDKMQLEDAFSRTEDSCDTMNTETLKLDITSAANNINFQIPSQSNVSTIGILSTVI